MLEDFRTLANDLLRDTVDRVTESQLDRALGLAVVQYSKDRPRRTVEDVTADGGHLLDLPAGAIQVVSVEYPLAKQPPSFLRRWTLYEEPTSTKVMLPFAVVAGAPVRLTVVRPHELTELVDTIPDQDREAVASYASAVLHDQMAAETSSDGNPTIPADTVNHAAKPENFAKRAERLRQRYYDLLGIDVKRTRPSSVLVSQPLASSVGGPRLIHRSRRKWFR